MLSEDSAKRRKKPQCLCCHTVFCTKWAILRVLCPSKNCREHFLLTKILCFCNSWVLKISINPCINSCFTRGFQYNFSSSIIWVWNLACLECIVPTLYLFQSLEITEIFTRLSVNTKSSKLVIISSIRASRDLPYSGFYDHDGFFFSISVHNPAILSRILWCYCR